MFGIIHLPWWGYGLVLLVFTQLTIFSVTLYLHRCQSHRALELHPVVSHFFRFWLWLTTGMETKKWTAIHRKHHAKVETVDDPHSPQIKGIKKVLFEGAELYKKEAKNLETLLRYGEGTPDDWIENNLYTPHSFLGIMVMLVLNLVLFGIIGITIWAIQMAWIPFFAAGVINGIGHYFGYRNFECQDASRNIIPWGLWIGGEELHNNHHAYATSAKFSAKWWEIDIGWGMIQILKLLGLACPKKVLSKPLIKKDKNYIDSDTLKAVIIYRFQVLSFYTRKVILPALREERRKTTNSVDNQLLFCAKTLLICDASIMKVSQKKHLAKILETFQNLRIVYQLRLQLQSIWTRSTTSQKELVESLQEWCKQAEETNIHTLSSFVHSLKRYIPPSSVSQAPSLLV